MELRVDDECWKEAVDDVLQSRYGKAHRWKIQRALMEERAHGDQLLGKLCHAATSTIHLDEELRREKKRGEDLERKLLDLQRSPQARAEGRRSGDQSPVSPMRGRFPGKSRGQTSRAAAAAAPNGEADTAVAHESSPVPSISRRSCLPSGAAVGAVEDAPRPESRGRSGQQRRPGTRFGPTAAVAAAAPRPTPLLTRSAEAAGCDEELRAEVHRLRAALAAATSGRASSPRDAHHAAMEQTLQAVHKRVLEDQLGAALAQCRRAEKQRDRSLQRLGAERQCKEEAEGLVKALEQQVRELETPSTTASASTAPAASQGIDCCRPVVRARSQNKSEDAQGSFPRDVRQRRPAIDSAGEKLGGRTPNRKTGETSSDLRVAACPNAAISGSACGECDARQRSALGVVEEKVPVIANPMSPTKPVTPPGDSSSCSSSPSHLVTAYNVNTASDGEEQSPSTQNAQERFAECALFMDTLLQTSEKDRLWKLSIENVALLELHPVRGIAGEGQEEKVDSMSELVEMAGLGALYSAPPPDDLERRYWDGVLRLRRLEQITQRVHEQARCEILRIASESNLGAQSMRLAAQTRALWARFDSRDAGGSQRGRGAGPPQHESAESWFRKAADAATSRCNAEVDHCIADVDAPHSAVCDASDFGSAVALDEVVMPSVTHVPICRPPSASDRSRGRARGREHRPCSALVKRMSRSSSATTLDAERAPRSATPKPDTLAWPPDWHASAATPPSVPRDVSLITCEQSHSSKRLNGDPDFRVNCVGGALPSDDGIGGVAGGTRCFALPALSHTPCPRELSPLSGAGSPTRLRPTIAAGAASNAVGRGRRSQRRPAELRLCSAPPTLVDEHAIDRRPKLRSSMKFGSQLCTPDEGSPAPASPSLAQGTSTRQTGVPHHSRPTTPHRRSNTPHARPQQREGQQRSLCQEVVICYPKSLPSKTTFPQRKVPRPVSPEGSPEDHECLQVTAPNTLPESELSEALYKENLHALRSKVESILAATSKRDVSRAPSVDANGRSDKEDTPEMLM